ncbi:YggS family pyridoxal phosphate-dependent enzyme [Melaminivora sp.]|uniref:YggS family pyridoxal phosphate-dependent enzyme n=1 Tax=Melaminivora sp. TaxID=1933032 RepID=UPI0028AC450D|nr:YggS family pyridoxal phosphate-dependent enzyme [Melaminivora sp.]
MTNIIDTVAARLNEVRARIDSSCAAAGRPAGSVALLAVSKTFGPEAVLAAAQAGQRAFGENYLQEAVDKMAALQGMAPALAGELVWHCIGPLQSNKTRLVAGHFAWAHTIDRLKIAQRLSDQRPPGMPPLNVCIQVNVDGGANKSGVAPGEALELACAAARLPRLALRGVMAIPEPQQDFAAQLAVHQRVRAVFDAIAASGAEGLERFDTLSLGMTGDLEAAVAAGSTLVRVGSGIFGVRAVHVGAT